MLHLTLNELSIIKKPETPVLCFMMKQNWNNLKKCNMCFKLLLIPKISKVFYYDMQVH